MTHWTDEELAHRFIGWWQSDGNWVYCERSEALRVWETRGIEYMRPPTPRALELVRNFPVGRRIGPVSDITQYATHR